MSSKLYYRLGLEELVEPELEPVENEAETVEKAAEAQTDIQNDLTDIEKLQDDHETLQDAAVALEAALKNGYPASSLTFVRQTIQRIDNRWGMRHRIASMENASSDAEVIASMEGAVTDGIKKTGKAILEMLKRVWAKLKEWVGHLIEKIGNGVKKLGGLLKRSKELQAEVPKEKQHEVDHELLAQAIGQGSTARTMELFSTDGKEFGGIKIFDVIASRFDAGISHITAAFNLLNQLHGKVKPDFTPENVGEIVKSYVDDAFPRRISDQTHLDAPAGEQDAWTLLPTLSAGYAFVIFNGSQFNKSNPTPQFPRIVLHKTNQYSKMASSANPDIEWIAKHMVITAPGDLQRLADTYSKLSDKTLQEMKAANQRFENYSSQMFKFCERSEVGQNDALNRYLLGFVSGAAQAAYGSTRAVDTYLSVMNALIMSYIGVMNRYWELVAKKSQPAA